jgi:hypothetical protein
MKLKFLLSILFVCLLAIVSDAQTNASPQRFDISIAAKDQTFYINSGAWLVKVKITNRSNEIWNLKAVRAVHFIFNKTVSGSEYDESLDFYDFNKERLIKPGESFDFEVDLKKQAWIEPSNDSTFIPADENRKPYYPALSGYYVVFASIDNCQEVPLKENPSRPEAGNCHSNQLVVKVEAKTDK